MTLRIAVVHEAEADFTTATELADRVLIDVIKWMDEDQLPYQREWLAGVAGQRLKWTAMKQLPREAGIRVHGHFDGEPGLPDAAAARRAIRYLLTVEPEIQAIVLVRDQDDQPDRHGGLNQARDQDKSGVPVVVGLAVVEREAWVISGFDPQDEEETRRLELERARLGFYPHQNSHELTACKDDQAARSPKRVLQELAGGSWQRERQCWTKALLDSLRRRGGDNGLAAYLQEVRDRLATLIGHVPGNSDANA